MHLTSAISVLENADSGGLHNSIVDIFYVALVDDPMPLPHALPQLEPNIFLKVHVSVASQVHIPQAIVSIIL